MKMKLDERQKAKMFEYGIPERMHSGIRLYYENGIEPGDFLCAVINNDLSGAIDRADDQNARCLKAYVMWFYNQAPSGSWGSAGAVGRWITKFHEEHDTENADENHSV